MKEELKTKRKATRNIFRMIQKKDISISIILFFISRATVLGGFPMTLPFFAAICDLSACYIYFPMLFFGTMSAGANVIKYFSASLIFWIISELRLREAHRITNSIYCGIIIIFTGLMDLFFVSPSAYNLFLLIIEGIISSIMYYSFSGIKYIFNNYKTPRHITKEEIISLVLLVCSVLLGLSDISLPININISQLIGIYLIFFVVMYIDITAAITLSIIIGFVSSISADSIILMGIMASGTIFASLLKMYGKYGIISGFLAGVSICMMYISNKYTIPISIISLFLSSLLFLLTPDFLHKKIYKFFLNHFYPAYNETEVRIKDYISSELKCISDTFKNLSAKLLTAAEYPSYNVDAALSSIFDGVTSRICKDCPNSELCWKEKLNDTCKQLILIKNIMDENGICDMTNIPIVFSQRCRMPEKFITEFNHVYEIYKQDSLWKKEANRRRDLVAKQYCEISSIIKNISFDIRHGFYFNEEKEDIIYRKLLDEKIPVSDVTVIENSNNLPEIYITPIYHTSNERLKKIVSSAMNMPMRIYDDITDTLKLTADNLFYTEISVKQRPGEGQTISGDSVLYFESSNNKFYVILCDGMGSGDEALFESKTTAELLKEFIIANIQIETAIKIVNSSLTLKTDDEIFSTVDILEINLLTGETHMYKVGSAPSYIKCSKNYETVFSKNLPIGIIDEILITHEARNLSDGDIIVMVSDGISEADYGTLRGEWIKKIMAYENEGVFELSTFIINNAAKKIFPNVADDMTVVVLKIKMY